MRFLSFVYVYISGESMVVITVLWFCIITCFVTGFGKKCIDLLHIERPDAEKIILGFYLGYGFFMLFLYCLGLFSLLTFPALLLLLAFFLLCSHKDLFFTVTFIFQAIWHIKIPKSIQWPSLLWILLFVFFVCNAILTFLPFTEWDAVAYHLPLAQWYGKTHSISPPPYMFHAQYPQLEEVLWSVGYILPGSPDTFISLTIFFIHHVFFVFLYQFLKQKYNKHIALYALALAYTIPEVSIYITDAYVDLTTAIFCTLSFFMLLLFITQKHFRLLILSFCFAGVAAGIKYTGLFFVLFIAFVAASILLFSQHKKQLFFIIILGMLFSSLFFIPQYLKNYYYVSNPLYPFASSLFPSSKALDTDIIDAWNRNYNKEIVSFGNLFLLPYTMTFHSQFFGSIYGIGPLFLIFLPYILSQLFLKKSKTFLFMGLTTVLFTLLWYFTQPSYRFLFFCLWIWCILIAIILYEIISAHKKYAVLFIILFIAAILCNAGAYGLIHRGGLRVLAHAQTTEDYLKSRVQSYGVDQYINTHLSSGAILITNPEGYYIQQQYMWGESISNMKYIDYSSLDTAEDFYLLLREKGITHIRLSIYPGSTLCSSFFPGYYSEHIAGLYSELIDTHAVLIYEENGVYLYQMG